MVPLGRVKESEEWHRRKAEIDRAHDKYRKTMFDGDDLSSRANELAALTSTLGRPFDSQAWSILAEAQLRDPAPMAAGSADPSVSLRFPRVSRPRRRSFRLPTRFASGRDRSRADARRPARRPAAGGRSRRLGRRPPLLPIPRGPSPDFVDDAEKAGLRFVFDNGKTPQHLLPETMSGGLGLIDFDGDGWYDVYCVQGGPLHALPAAPAEERAGGRAIVSSAIVGTAHSST